MKPKLALFLAFTGVFGFIQNSENSNTTQSNGGLFLPEGFEATVVVDSLDGKARHIAVNDNGDIYVKARYAGPGESVIALRDTNHDGRADIIKKFGGSTQERGYGTAVRIYKGYLYFSSELVVYRYKLTPGDLVPQSPQEVILTDDHPHGMHEHIAKPLSFDNEGNMYVPYGAPSNACQEQNRTPGSKGMDPCPLLEDHGGIWRFDAGKPGQTQKDGVLFATGLRSIVAMDWNSADKNLYVVQHGRDDLVRLWPQLYSAWQSAMLPSEEFLRIKEGSHSGWPYCYYDQLQNKKVLQPEYGGDGKIVGPCGKYEKPVIGFPGHWAPNDLLFYTGDELPAHYKNGAFIAFHGSTNRAPYPQSSYFIGFVPFKNGQTAGPYEIFADGFAGISPIINTNEALYRPMGIAMGPDGALYISETEKGKIWRITYTGNRATFSSKNRVTMEKRKSLSHIRTPDPIKDNMDKEKVSAGEKVYITYCAPCHQRNGLGDGQRFPPLSGSNWVTGEKQKLITVILKGLEGPIEVSGKSYNNVMPQHSFLKDSEIAEVATYIRSNFGNQASPVRPEEVKKIRSTPATR